MNIIYIFVAANRYAHSYFALGWKGMETGWYALAHSFFDQALERDPDYYMATVGKMLSHENMGYGVGNYKEQLLSMSTSPDFRVKLSRQEQLLVQALNSLQNGKDFGAGLDAMTNTFDSDTSDTLKDYIIRVVDGNGNLLFKDQYQILASVAKSDESVFALHLLTHNLNPYKNGKNRITEASQKAATDAIFLFNKLEVTGAWVITSDCVDIAEYYSKWSVGIKLLSSHSSFLSVNGLYEPNPTSGTLLGQNDKEIFIRGINITYMSKSINNLNKYERLHFYQLQV